MIIIIKDIFLSFTLMTTRLHIIPCDFLEFSYFIYHLTTNAGTYIVIVQRHIILSYLIYGTELNSYGPRWWSVWWCLEIIISTSVSTSETFQPRTQFLFADIGSLFCSRFSSTNGGWRWNPEVVTVYFIFSFRILFIISVFINLEFLARNI